MGQKSMPGLSLGMFVYTSVSQLAACDPLGAVRTFPRGMQAVFSEPMVNYFPRVLEGSEKCTYHLCQEPSLEKWARGCHCKAS